jgi:DNA-binding LacI/PurR family transcriptional regulator
LKNDPRIGKATRERIRAAAEALGYRPIPALEKAMQQMSRARHSPLRDLLGFIIGPAISRGWYARDILEGATHRAGALGYKAECFYLDETERASQQLERQLRARNIRGLLILPLDRIEADPGLHWEKFSVVNTTSLKPQLSFHSVHNDDFGNSERLIQAILAQGFKRPGLIMLSDIDRRMHHALSANYLWTWTESLALPAIPPFYLDAPDASATLGEWFSQYKPDALLVADADMRDWLAPLLPASPKPPSWFAYSQAQPVLPGLFPDFGNIGSAAVDLLTAQLMRDEYGLPQFAKRVMVQARLHKLPDPTGKRT